MNPEQTVRLFGLYFFDVDLVEQFHGSFKRPVIDFHRQHFDGTALRIFRLGHIAVSANDHAMRLNSQDWKEIEILDADNVHSMAVRVQQLAGSHA